MILPRILYAQGSKEDNIGAGLLILTEGDPIIGHIILYEDYITMISRLNQKEPVAYSIVPSYSIVIQYAGILGRGNRIDPTQIEKVKKVMQEFSLWYLLHKISPHKARFKRYLV